MEQEKKDHFSGKTVREHLAEVQARTLSQEIHGAEIRGTKEAFFDSFRDTALVLGALFFLVGGQPHILFVCIFAWFWCLWRAARAAIHSWAYLKKVHHLTYEERCEILANREQEREELLVLYQDKGFTGPLLEKVVDVLMADQERLLRVMLQEELGLKLVAIDHPLKSALWAFAGSFLSFFLSVVLLPSLPLPWNWLCLSMIAGLSSVFLSYKDTSICIRAFVWTTLAACAAFQALFFLISLVA